MDNENEKDENIPELPQENIEESINESNNGPEGAGEDDPMAQGTPNPSTPRKGPVTEHFDLSQRASSKRQVDGDDMDDDSPEKRLRPRSPTVLYRTDADSDVMDDGTLSGLNEVIRRSSLRPSWVWTALNSSHPREWREGLVCQLGHLWT